MYDIIMPVLWWSWLDNIQISTKHAKTSLFLNGEAQGRTFQFIQLAVLQLNVDIAVNHTNS